MIFQLNTSTSLKPSKETYVKEMNPVFYYREEFQNQGSSKLDGLSWHPLNVKITERYAKADIISKKVGI